MSDLTSIFGGPFTPSPPSPRSVASVESQFRQAFMAAGMAPPRELILDGKLHRFITGSGTKNSIDPTGYYVGHEDATPCIFFGDWRTGEETTFRADIGRTWTIAEELAHKARIASAQAARKAEDARRHQSAAITVESIWRAAAEASADHPYLKRKGVQPHGLRIGGDGRLIAPLFTPDGNLSSLQYIDASGGKLYHAGGKAGGTFWMIGTMDAPGPLYIAEGFATAATIHETVHRPCVVAYSASGLVPACEAMRARHGLAQDIIIVADNDASGTGQRYAEQASAKFGARMVMPPIEGQDANDYLQSGGDLAGLLMPKATDWLISAKDFSGQPAPIRWLVKNWVQAGALTMVHGESGGGKSFTVLNWACHIAARSPEWAGNRIAGGPVVYLAGEGVHGLRGRVAAWRSHYGVDAPEIWISRAGCDLNTMEGHSFARTEISALPVHPVLIVVDTLSSFFAGDENSSEEAKQMIKMCQALMDEFKCAVLLVHHTGVSAEAQHRARGSSAWKAALDCEISVIKGKDGGPIELKQRKMKDAEEAEPVFIELQSVHIPGWLDEDGEPVKSAVAVVSAAPVRVKKPGKLDEYIRILTRAWPVSGGEVDQEGRPYISWSALQEYLVKDCGVAHQTAKNWLVPSRVNGLINLLIENKIVIKQGHGWAVMDNILASVMVMENS